jgi:hypothetical protein
MNKANQKIVEAAIILLKSTLGNMPSHEADKVVALVAELLETMK